jgi:hypothetical protein
MIASWPLTPPRPQEWIRAIVDVVRRRERLPDRHRLTAPHTGGIPVGVSPAGSFLHLQPTHPPPHAQRAQTTPLPGSASELERRRVCLSFAPSRPMTPRGAEASRACGLACPVPCVCVVCAPSLVGSLLQSGAHACCTCLSRDRPRPRPPGPLRMLAAAVVSSGARWTVEWPGPR